jgi:hypothetical protein
MNETIQELNQTHSIFQSDKLNSELRILDWILYQVCINQQSLEKDLSNFLLSFCEHILPIPQELMGGQLALNCTVIFTRASHQTYVCSQFELFYNLLMSIIQSNSN